jgi:uncharacterized paraquat-inducible protein A
LWPVFQVIFTTIDMWIVAIAWIYVATMMAVANAMSPDGSVLGAVAIFLFYGVAPTALVMYILNTSRRRRLRRAQAMQQVQVPQSPDTAPTPQTPP